MSLLVVGVVRRLCALLVYSAGGAGLLVTMIMQPLFGIVQGSFKSRAPIRLPEAELEPVAA